MRGTVFFRLMPSGARCRSVSLHRRYYEVQVQQHIKHRAKGLAEKSRQMGRGLGGGQGGNLCGVEHESKTFGEVFATMPTPHALAYKHSPSSDAWA